ncbi:MAG: TIGR00159 family protein [Deltaproteobacteria bacterium]|nr:TIGR00159 family protein [Deltaproteobacteria bacterium]
MTPVSLYELAVLLPLGLIPLLVTLYAAVALYREVRGTPSEHALWGALALSASYLLLKALLGQRLPLNLGAWLGTSWGILVTLLFAEELKRALRRLGEAVNPERLFGGAPRLSQRVMEEVLRATETLSRRSTGALIVVRQRADLSTFVRQGVRLDAEVSAELLYALFISDRDNHLHDGAALIEGERLTRASTYLPMSRALTLNQRLGTRHRAALGLSEETDALVVVVSEERGSVSLAYAGRLEEDLDPTALRRRLQAFVSGERASGLDERA